VRLVLAAGGEVAGQEREVEGQVLVGHAAVKGLRGVGWVGGVGVRKYPQTWWRRRRPSCTEEAEETILYHVDARVDDVAAGQHGGTRGGTHGLSGMGCGGVRWGEKIPRRQP
jgi:hypothetical protein